ncbi:hypothetical protein HNR61_005237 [Actinomadura namibiensis]|uniref:Uncharacterized protein n=1 Tax=Actinomadura namibiensis TaxID=182080 RepID=A0A7W3LSN2_ACTNM|nr:hypothetical protein [Actinomadura namibiensis]
MEARPHVHATSDGSTFDERFFPHNDDWCDSYCYP